VYLFYCTFQILEIICFAVVTRSCDTELGTATPVLVGLSVRTINTPLRCLSAYGISRQEERVHYRTGPRAPKLIVGLRLFTVHSALLLASVYSARILEEFHLIRYKIYHPPNAPLHRILFISEPSFDGLITHSLYPSETGRWFHFTIGCLASFAYIAS